MEGTQHLHIPAELPKPYITSNNSNPVENKDAVALTCEPETQNTTYLWWINGQSLPVSPRLQLSSDNRTLTLFSITRNDTGPYECEIQNPASAYRSDPVTPNVLYGPDALTISPLDTSYRPGENLTLSCHAASNPPAQYSWFINGIFQQSTQVLFIPNVTVDRSGSYTCYAHNSATGHNSTTGRIITVSAELSKPFITSNNSSPVENKDAVALTCEPETQDTTYLWWVNGQSLLVSPRRQLSSDNRTLTLLSVTRNDAGTYECEIQNPVSANRSDPVTLNVTCEYLLFLCGPDCQPKSTRPEARTLSPPQIQRCRSSPLDTQAGHNFLPQENLGRLSLDQEWEGRGCFCPGRLRIHSLIGTRLRGILWSFYNQELPLSSDDITCGFVLFAPDGPDTPIISPPDSSYRSGANLNLSCHSTSNPPPTYSWYINETLQSHTQVLFIPQITSNHNGAYTCFVSNSATGRNNSAVKNISVSVPGGSVVSAGTTVNIMTGVLAGVALIAALV
ncbi:hypothetical protein P7K49_034452 [Saguinus oedipus]|uniref:Ig-like domain-containing protein n=1 Tax=Saguinus oedipus TaxID=9490 RepID=A0ABQ9TVL2_SAGOE|nr:hypothetical protein P7K49_034452 [Saguinus oedipus]